MCTNCALCLLTVLFRVVATDQNMQLINGDLNIYMRVWIPATTFVIPASTFVIRATTKFRDRCSLLSENWRQYCLLIVLTMSRLFQDAKGIVVRRWLQGQLNLGDNL